MGGNNGKAKKQKAAVNRSQENRRRQVQKAARDKALEIEDRAKAATPASDKELQRLAEAFSRKR